MLQEVLARTLVQLPHHPQEAFPEAAPVLGAWELLTCPEQHRLQETDEGRVRVRVREEEEMLQGLPKIHTISECNFTVPVLEIEVNGNASFSCHFTSAMT